MKHDDGCMIHTSVGRCTCSEKPEPPAAVIPLEAEVVEAVTLIPAQSRASQVEAISSLLAKAPPGGENVLILIHWKEKS